MKAASPVSSSGAAGRRAFRHANPYVIGAGLGVLSWLAFGLFNQPLGITTSLSAASSVCALPFVGADGVAANAYWMKTPAKWDYGMLFLAGTFLGALGSALTGRVLRFETVPAVWAERFGSTPWKRLLAAFLGGIIIMYGARMAGGCTSGHGISGSLQLAVSSWIFFLTLFATGALTAWVLFGRSSSR